MPRCPRCRRQFRVPEDEDSGHACPRCGYGEPCDCGYPEVEREWSDEDYRLDEGDRKNDEEAEDAL